MTSERRPRPAALGLLLGSAALIVSSCSSGSPRRTSSVSAATGVTSPPTPATSAPGTTVAGQLPTVYDCGGGAYRPATLLIVCGVGSTMATGVRWSSWTVTSAAGTGSVALSGHPPVGASLLLGGVVESASGPQFSRLEVTWTGPSPDGRPSDVFTLATAPAR